MPQPHRRSQLCKHCAASVQRRNSRDPFQIQPEIITERKRRLWGAVAFGERSAMLELQMPFQLESNYKPRGDQGQAIAKLLKSVEAGNRHQTLLGVTGSGKTFTIANVIRDLDRPTLVISHNKTLAAQLYSEFKQFFPRNAVEYFVSYFDYYQPEAYIPRSDTYIEKDSSINEEIERLRLAATSALL